MFKHLYDTERHAMVAFSLTVFAGTLLAWSQVVAPHPDLSTFARVIIGGLGSALAITGGLGVYTVSYNQEMAAAKQSNNK